MAKPLEGFGFHWNELDGFRFESYSRSRFIPIYLALAFIIVIVFRYISIELADIDPSTNSHYFFMVVYPPNSCIK